MRALTTGIIVALVAIIIGGAYYFSINTTNNVVKIVTSYPMQKISVGQDIVNGITLALEHANYKAGEFDIELVVKDDGDADGHWLEELEAQNAEAAANDPDVMVYLAPFNSGAAKISIPITNKAGLAQISPGNTWPGLTQPGFLPGEPGVFYPTGVRSYFRICPTDALQGPAGAIWAKELGAKTVYIFDDGEAFGVGIAKLFIDKAEEIGLTVIGQETLNKRADDFTAELRSLQDTQPDLIYFAGITPNGGVPLVKGVRELLPGTLFMGSDGIREQAFLDGAGVAAEGVYTAIVGVPPDQLTGEGKVMVDAYVERFGKEPGTYSVFGYEAANVALRAIEKAGEKDRRAIMEEIASIKEYNGVLGTWGFDRNGDTTLTLVSGSVVKNGAFEFQKLLGTN